MHHQQAFKHYVFEKQKTENEVRISDWSSDVSSSDLVGVAFKPGFEQCARNRLDAGPAGLRQQLQPSRVVVMRQHAVQVEQDNGRHVAHALATRNASRAATTVRSMTSSSCALDMKPASYADGARYTPRSSMAWKKRLNAAASQATAWA